jgi:hypothetical protein
MYRVRSNGNVVSQGEVRKLFPNTSLPRVWSADVCNQLGIDPVLESPAPEVTRYQTASKSGVTQDANGNWVWAWVVGPTFTEYTDEEGVTHTAEEQEAAYIQRIDDEQATAVRVDRDKRLADTDWTQLIDSPFSTDTNGVWQTYRQALRDIPSQVGFPWDVTWPDQPE